jgi:small subunit ribosomal protein S14
VAKKSIIARDRKREKIIARFAATREKIKEMINNVDTSFDEKQQYFSKLQKLPRNSSPSRLTKRCKQCGRPHAVYRKFGICRICLRNILPLGQVPGGRKSSW